MDSQVLPPLDVHGPGTSVGVGGGPKRAYEGSSSESVASFATDSVSVTQNSVVSGSVANSVVGPDGKRSVKSVSIIGSRQRVTVVCAECKRLKLKCDRRTPCGSCTKRDTVDRCIYSQAAAEKVDVQSLNIRLQAVEGKLSGMTFPPGTTTSGAGPSNAQNPSSSLPSHAIVPATSSHQRAFLAIGAHGSSVAVNLEGYAGLWVDQLGLNKSTEVPRDAPVSIGELDLERLGVRPVRRPGRGGIELRPFPSVPGAGAIDFLESCTSLFRIPASLVASDEARRDAINDDADGGHDREYEEEEEDSDQVGVSPRLVHQTLPSAQMRREIYKRFEQYHMFSPSVNVFVFKSRVEEMCLWAEMRLNKSANGNGIGDENGSRGEPLPIITASTAGPRMTPPAGIAAGIAPAGTLTPPTLTFFAAAAFGLALGARCWLIEQDVLSPSSTPGATILSDSAGNSGSSNAAASAYPTASVYDPSMPPPPLPSHPFDPGTSVSPTSPVSGPANLHVETQPAPHIDRSLPVRLYRTGKYAVQLAVECGGYEAFDTDYIHAKCLQARYLLCSHQVSGECSDLLRDLGVERRKRVEKRERKGQQNGIEHGRDTTMEDAPELPSGARRKGKGKEKESTRGPSLALASETVSVVSELVGNARMMGLNYDPELTGGGRFSAYEIEMRRRLWWEVVFLDAFVAECLGENPFLFDSHATTELPTDVDEESFGPDSANRPAPNIELVHGNIDHFIQRSRLLELSRRLGRKIAAFHELHPDAPTSETCSLLVTMKAEFGNWQANLPDHLKMKDVPSVQSDVKMTSPSSKRQPGSPGDHDSTAGDVQLHFTAIRCFLHIAAHHMFMTLCLRLVKNSSKEKDDSRKSFFGPSLEGFDSMIMLEPALFIVRVWRYLHTIYRNEHPALFNCYAFAKDLFDAAIVLGHLAIEYPLFAGRALGSLRLASDTMRDPSVLTSKTSPDSDGNGNLPSEAVRIAEELIMRAETAAEAVNLDFGGDFGPPNVGTPSITKRKHEEVEIASSDLLYHFRFPFVGAGVVSVGPPTVPPNVPSPVTNGTPSTVRLVDSVPRSGSTSNRSKHGAGPGQDATTACDPRPASSRNKASHPQFSIRNRKTKRSTRARANSATSQRSDPSHRVSRANLAASHHSGAPPPHALHNGHSIPPNRVPSVEPPAPLPGPTSYPGPISSAPGPDPRHYNSPPGTSGGSSSQQPPPSSANEFSSGFPDSGSFPSTSPVTYGPPFPPPSGPPLPVPSQVGYEGFNLDGPEQSRDGLSLGRGEAATYGFASSSGLDGPGPIGMHQPASFDNMGGLPRPPPESQDRPFSRNLIDNRPHNRDTEDRIVPPMQSLDPQQHPPLHPPQVYPPHPQLQQDWPGYSQWSYYHG